MKTDIDYLISLMKEFTPKSEGDLDTELDEQETAPAEKGTEKTNSAGRKWETGLVRGKANKLGIKGEKWETGLTRGHANPVP